MIESHPRIKFSLKVSSFCVNSRLNGGILNIYKIDQNQKYLLISCYCALHEYQIFSFSILGNMR